MARTSLLKLSRDINTVALADSSAAFPQVRSVHEMLFSSIMFPTAGEAVIARTNQIVLTAVTGGNTICAQPLFRNRLIAHARQD